MEAKSQTKQRAIMTAALELFMERGFRDTSMDAIAERAIASKRTVYNHFGSKLDLFKSLVANLKAKEAGAKVALPGYDPTAPLSKQLTDTVESRFRGMFEPEHMRMVRMLIGESIRIPELATSFQDDMAMFGDLLVPWLLEAQADGKISVPDPKLASNLFWHSLMGLGHWPRLASHLDNKPDRWDETVQELIAMFLSRYATP